MLWRSLGCSRSSATRWTRRRSSYGCAPRRPGHFVLVAEGGGQLVGVLSAAVVPLLAEAAMMLRITSSVSRRLRVVEGSRGHWSTKQSGARSTWARRSSRSEADGDPNVRRPTASTRSWVLRTQTMWRRATGSGWNDVGRTRSGHRPVMRPGTAVLATVAETGSACPTMTSATRPRRRIAPTGSRLRRSAPR